MPLRPLRCSEPLFKIHYDVPNQLIDLRSRIRRSSRSVPPGAGTQATRDRNARRRKMRRALKAGAAGEVASLPAAAESDSSADPTRATVQDAASRPRTPSLMTMPANISNRNKRRGFVEEMQKFEPVHIVYSSTENDITKSLAETGENEPVPAESHATAAAPSTAKAASARSYLQRYMPPSDLSSLPPNVFVSTRQFLAIRAANRAKPAPAVAIPPSAPPAAVFKVTGDTLDEAGWQAAEAAWEKATVVTLDTASALRPGQIVAWKVRLQQRGDRLHAWRG